MSEIKKRSMDSVRRVKKPSPSIPQVSNKTPLSRVPSSQISRPKKKIAPSYIKSPTTPFVQRSFSWIAKNWFWFKYFIMILCVMLVVIIVANRRSKTEIAVTPHIEYLELNDSLVAYTNPNEDQLGFDIIAVTDEVSLPIDAAGTRAKEEKARGIITVYNNYSTEPQRLLPETRFESASGKIYKIGEQEIIIPGKSENAPGTIDVEVIAEKSGSEYNIDITDFSIPGFKDAGLNEKYQGMYAVSKKAFDGGIITTEGYIEPSQHENAQTQLQQQLTERLALRLEKENTENVQVLGTSAQMRFKESEFVADESGSKGLLTQKGTIVAVAVSKPSLNKYIVKNYLNLPENEQAKVIENDSLVVTMNSGVVDYNEIRNINLELNGKVLVQWEVSLEHISNELLGVQKDEIESILDTNNSIDTAQVDIFPPWKKTISNSANRIEIQVD